MNYLNLTFFAVALLLLLVALCPREEPRASLGYEKAPGVAEAQGKSKETPREPQ